MDPHKCASRLHIDKAFATSTLQKFGLSLREELNNFKAAVEARDASRLAELVHSLKGASAICAVDRLTELLEELEQGMEAPEWSKIEERLDNLEDVMGNVESECEAL